MKLRASSGEITKGNQIIAKLQSDGQALRGKLKLKQAVVLQLQEQGSHKEASLHTADRGASELRARIAELATDKERAEQGCAHPSHGPSVPTGTARARLQRLLGARLAALGGAALPGAEARPLGAPAIASGGTQASCLQRKFADSAASDPVGPQPHPCRANLPLHCRSIAVPLPSIAVPLPLHYRYRS